MALTASEIAGALRISRSEFGRLFLQAQAAVFDEPNDREAFHSVTQAGVDREAFEAALQWAEQRGFLAELAHRIADEGLEDGTIAQARAAAAVAGADKNAAVLQAITDLARGYQDPKKAVRGITMGTRWTVRVLVDNTFQGTGTLIGPHLVLTAWHVVRKLFDPDGQGAHRARADGGTRLLVEFEDVFGQLRQTISAHADWCAGHSACHPEELQSRLPANLAELSGFWDYAVIRLKNLPGLERQWAILDERAIVPGGRSPVIVFQYPQGHPMRFDQGAIVDPDAASAAAVPSLRFLHAANGQGGSSGGPCFDRSFMLFGMHQGVWSNKPGPAGAAVNRGIPITSILQDIKARNGSLPAPDPSELPVWHLSRNDGEAPIIGCEEFQRLVWRSVLGETIRVILIGGDSGRGKSFRLKVMTAMLPDAGHLKVRLEASVIAGKDAPGLAKEICKQAGATVPAFATASEFGSSEPVWLRDEVAEKLVQALGAVRGDRLVWLQFADLNKFALTGEQAAGLLLLLCEQTNAVPWLRVVLDGMKDSLPPAVWARLGQDRAKEFSEAEMAVYLRRVLAENEVPVEDTVERYVEGFMRRYNRLLLKDSATAARNLTEEMQDHLAAVLES